MSVIDEVQALQAATLAEIDQAATSDALEAIRIKVVGKSGKLDRLSAFDGTSCS